MLRRIFCIAALLLCLAWTAYAQDPGNPDTISIVDAVTVPGQDVAVSVNMYNDEELGAVTIPMHWSSPDISLDSVSFIGSRLAYIGNKPVTIYNTQQNMMFGAIVVLEEYIAPGSGLIAKMHFHVPAGTPDQFVTVDSISIPPAAELLLSATSGANIYPQMVAGEIKIGNPVEPAHITLSSTGMTFEGKVGFPDPSSQSLTISNSGGGTMVWNATHAQSWLSVNPATGTAPSVTSIHAVVGALPEGTYYDTVVVSCATADNSPVKLPVTLHITTMAPTIRFSPSQVAVSGVQGGANPPDKKLAIWTDVAGSTLNWTVTNSSSWLTLSPTSGTPPDSLTLQFDITGLAYGDYHDTVVISDPGASNNPQRVPVTLQVVSDLPVLELSPQILYVVVPAGTAVGTKTFQVLNSGEGTLTYQATESSSIIMSITPSSGTAPQEVTLGFKTFSLSVGDYIDTVIVTSPEAINSPQKLIVDFHITESPAMITLFPSSIDFSYYECWQGPDAIPPERTFQINNGGGDAMIWHLTHSADWLVVSDTTGVEKDFITLTLNADSMAVGTYVDTLVITSPQALNSPRYLPVTLNLIPGGEPPEMMARNTTVNIPAQEVFGIGLAELSSVAEVYNLKPGCMDYWVEDDIPWLRIIDTAGSAPALIETALEIGSYTYGVYPDSFYVYSSSATNSPQKLYVNMQVWRYHGDATWDLKINIADAVYIVNYLFKGGPAPKPTFITGDCNCDGFVKIGDAVYIVNYVFLGGNAPCGNP